MGEDLLVLATNLENGLPTKIQTGQDGSNISNWRLGGLKPKVCKLVALIKLLKSDDCYRYYHDDSDNSNDDQHSESGNYVDNHSAATLPHR